MNKSDLIQKLKQLEGITPEERAYLIELVNTKKKYGLVWENKPEEVEELLRDNLPVLKEVKEKAIVNGEDYPNHILIEGDNLHALTALTFTHEGKIDVIYIDPPYNTGAKDWKYNNDYVDINDNWRHSKWIQFIFKRLVIAKSLLKEEGALIITIDENEQAHLGVILEELFFNHEIHCITIVHNPRGVQGTNFSYTHEYAYFIIPRTKKTIGSRKIDESEIDWRNLRDNGGESLRENAKNCFYAIIVDPNSSNILGFGDVLPPEVHPESANIEFKTSVLVFPIDGKKIERKWRYALQSVENIKHLLRARKVKDIWQIEIGKDFGTYRTVWIDSRYDANEYGTKLIDSIIPGNGFNFPKSIYNVYDSIYAVIGNRKDAKVIDFFAGSGTSLHATMLLNKEDGGKRQCILATNNENKICEEITYERNKRVIQGYNNSKGEFTQGLIDNNLRYYKTDFISRDPSLKNKRELTRLSTELLCIKEDCYFECTTEMISGRQNWIKGFTDKKGQFFCVIYDDLKIGEAVEAISRLYEQKKPDKLIKVYVFSNGQYPYTEDFEEVLDKITLCALPDAIYKAYQHVLPKRQKQAEVTLDEENEEGEIQKGEEGERDLFNQSN